MTQPNMLLADAAAIASKALPSTAGSATSTAGIDLRKSPAGLHLAECELEISAPALNGTQLPDGKTMTYKVEHDDDAAFAAAAELFTSVIVQTGKTTSGGADAVAKRFRLPNAVKRYLRLTVTSGTGAGDASAASMAIQLLF